MPKYLLVYHGGKAPESPEEGAAVMAKWGAWMGSLGDALVDGGNPVGASKTVFADKVADNGGANPASGYSLISAADMKAAIGKARGCPIFDAGGNIEIAEAVEM